MAVIIKGGFYNAILDNAGKYDRKYNADDYSTALSFVVGNGVININNGTSMQVYNGTVSGSTYGVSIKSGFGWINGKWFNNPKEETLNGISAPTQGRKRYDRIVVRRYNNIVGDYNRDFILDVITGAETAETPTKPNLTRNETSYELCLANVLVTRGDTVTVSIEDTRRMDDICGWVNGYFGDSFEEYMQAIKTAVDNQLEVMQARANDWVDNNSMTKTTIYRRTETVTTAGTVFNVGIASYNPESDDLAIFVNGSQEYENELWTRNGTTITFVRIKDPGTKITFEVTKSLDGVGLNDAAQTISNYEERIKAIEDNIAGFNYKCNESTDNIELSNIVNDFLKKELSDYDMLKIEIHGKFGMTTAYNGTGATTNAYKWFNFADFTGNSNRRVLLDFSNCSGITFPIEAGTNNILFHIVGSDIRIKGITFLAQQTANNTTIQGIYTTTGNVILEDCRGWIDCYNALIFAKRGQYDNCRMSCVSLNDNCMIFNPSVTDHVIVNGGEYYAYTGNGTYSTISYHDSASANAVTILNSVRMPTNTRASYRQTNCVRINSGYINMTNCITALQFAGGGSTSSVVGTIPISK